MKRLIAGLALTIFMVGCGQTQPVTSTNSNTNTPPAANVESGPPKIPHKVTEGMVCKDCHASGANGAKISKHPDRPNCTKCHQTKE